MTWACCVTARWGCCSAGSWRRPRWSRSSRAFTWGNALQLQKVHRQFLAELARRAPLLPGADVLALLDTDSQQKRVYGHAKQGRRSGSPKSRAKACWCAA